MPSCLTLPPMPTILNGPRSGPCRQCWRKTKDSRGETMNRVRRLAFPVAVAAIVLFFGVGRLPAQAQKPASPPAAQPPAEAEDDRFAPDPPPVLPPGMTGSDVNDPRAKLSPGLY